MIALYELIDMIPDATIPALPNRLQILLTFLREADKRMDEDKARKQFLKTTAKKKYFNRLKNDLKHELAHFIIANPSVWTNTGYKAQHEECYKMFMTYKVLLLSGKRTAAIEIARLLLLQAQDFEVLWEEILGLLENKFRKITTKKPTNRNTSSQA